MKLRRDGVEPKPNRRAKTTDLLEVEPVVAGRLLEVEQDVSGEFKKAWMRDIQDPAAHPHTRKRDIFNFLLCYPDERGNIAFDDLLACFSDVASLNFSDYLELVTIFPEKKQQLQKKFDMERGAKIVPGGPSADVEAKGWALLKILHPEVIEGNRAAWERTWNKLSLWLHNSRPTSEEELKVFLKAAAAARLMSPEKFFEIGLDRANLVSATQLVRQLIRQTPVSHNSPTNEVKHEMVARAAILSADEVTVDAVEGIRLIHHSKLAAQPRLPDRLAV